MLPMAPSPEQRTSIDPQEEGLIATREALRTGKVHVGDGTTVTMYTDRERASSSHTAKAYSRHLVRQIGDGSHTDPVPSIARAGEWLRPEEIDHTDYSTPKRRIGRETKPVSMTTVAVCHEFRTQYSAAGEAYLARAHDN